MIRCTSGMGKIVFVLPGVSPCNRCTHDRWCFQASNTKYAREVGGYSPHIRFRLRSSNGKTSQVQGPISCLQSEKEVRNDQPGNYAVPYSSKLNRRCPISVPLIGP
jgi:hypothetical protein